MDDFGFIITRHVNSEQTNRYWNRCIKCIRRFYPFKKIVVIDDNSIEDFLKADFNYRNIEIIKSEFPGRGEILPYYYFYKRRFFNNAIIIHDSVFFHKRIDFERFRNVKVMPLWHFNKDRENIPRTIEIANYLNNNYKHIIQKKISFNDNVMGLNHDIWYGCFGIQSYINLDFLCDIENKYNMFNMLKIVKNRKDRCTLERIIGTIFVTEYPGLTKFKSLFGDIFHYQRWGYTYENYIEDFKNGKLPRYIIKVWTGR